MAKRSANEFEKLFQRRRKVNVFPVHTLRERARPGWRLRLAAARGSFAIAMEKARWCPGKSAALKVIEEWAEEELRDPGRLKPSTIERIMELEAQDWRAHSIALELGVSEPTVRRLIGAKTKLEPGKHDKLTLDLPGFKREREAETKR